MKRERSNFRRHSLVRTRVGREISEIRKLTQAKPFRPFLIHLADGRRIPVKHREFMALSPSGRTAYVYQMNDDSDVIDVALVISLELRKSLANANGGK